jgi:hypothetical protein
VQCERHHQDGQRAAVTGRADEDEEAAGRVSRHTDPPAAGIVSVATRDEGSVGLLDTACTDLRVLAAAFAGGGDLADEDVKHTLWRIEERVALVRDALVAKPAAPIGPNVVDLASRRGP